MSFSVSLRITQGDQDRTQLRSIEFKTSVQLDALLVFAAGPFDANPSPRSIACTIKFNCTCWFYPNDRKPEHGRLTRKRARKCAMLDSFQISRLRVVLLTLGGTLLCTAVAFLFDSFDLPTGTWRWGTSPINNVVLPLILAMPLLYLLLSKHRELALAHRELIAISSTDSLTQCLNRRAYTALVEGYLASIAPEYSPRGALLIIDVDFFKSVNDRFGHDSGDDALRVIGQAIKATLEPSDLVARIGGEEFSVFMPDVDEDKALQRSESIRSAIAETKFHAGDVRVPLTVSVGTVLVVPGMAFKEVYRAADQLMYNAKAAGRNRVSIAGESLQAA